MTDAERLTRLEERYAHLQRHSTEQDKVMLQLSEELTKLRKELAALRTRASEPREAGDATEEKPPHY